MNRPADGSPQDSSKPAFTAAHRVEFVDTDMAGIVHFTNFFRYMEQAEAEFFRAFGHTLAGVPNAEGTAVGWPRVAASASFKSPAYHNDVLEIRISIRRRGFKSLTLAFEFFRKETLIATGQIKTAFCRFRTGHPIESLPIPSEYNAMLGPYDPASGEESVEETGGRGTTGGERGPLS